MVAGYSGKSAFQLTHSLNSNWNIHICVYGHFCRTKKKIVPNWIQLQFQQKPQTSEKKVVHFINCDTVRTLENEICFFFNFSFLFCSISVECIRVKWNTWLILSSKKKKKIVWLTANKSTTCPNGPTKHFLILKYFFFSPHIDQHTTKLCKFAITICESFLVYFFVVYFFCQFMLLQFFFSMYKTVVRLNEWMNIRLFGFIFHSNNLCIIILLDLSISFHFHIEFLGSKKKVYLILLIVFHISVYFLSLSPI